MKRKGIQLVSAMLSSQFHSPDRLDDPVVWVQFVMNLWACSMMYPPVFPAGVVTLCCAPAIAAWVQLWQFKR
jgi:hypothetical protein